MRYRSVQLERSQFTLNHVYMLLADYGPLERTKLLAVDVSAAVMPLDQTWVMNKSHVL